MIIPLIEKDPKANDFTCRDGEIELLIDTRGRARSVPATLTDTIGLTWSLTPEFTFPTANIRIPLESGDKEKANMLLAGEISRVDPATAERLTQSIVQKAAECLLDLSTDYRRQGLFLLPFRCYAMTMLPDGTLSYPSAQAIVLPTDFPPHPEITAASATDNALTLSIRFPVKPHRLIVSPSTNLPSGYRLRTFISYPLYIPDPKEIRGSIGSVKSAAGGNAVGIRFAFLSKSAIKASVAAPEKYYEMVGNELTGYRLSSKATSPPDYSCHADAYGYVPAFPRESLIALGNDVDVETDPLDWIADWLKAGEGFLPASLPYKYWYEEENVEAWPDGVDKEGIMEWADTLGMEYVLLTRPMALASDSRSRRNAEPRAIRSIRVHGIGDEEAMAILFGSDDCLHWEPLRRFDPRESALVLSPRRPWWRVMIMGTTLVNELCIINYALCIDTK